MEELIDRQIEVAPAAAVNGSQPPVFKQHIALGRDQKDMVRQ